MHRAGGGRVVRRLPDVGARVATTPWFLFLRAHAEADAAVEVGPQPSESELGSPPHE